MFQKITISYPNNDLKILETIDFLACEIGTASFFQPWIDKLMVFLMEDSMSKSFMKLI